MGLTGPEAYAILCLLVAGAAVVLCLTPSPPDQEESSTDTDRCMPTVLVVEDDAVPTKMMKHALEKAGFTVLTAGNGVKALDLIRYSDKVNVVLLDCQLPRLDGAETLGHMRKYFKNVKVIGVTGLEFSMIPDSYRQGVDLLLLKPVKSSDLVEAVCSVTGVKIKA